MSWGPFAMFNKAEGEAKFGCFGRRLAPRQLVTVPLSSLVRTRSPEQKNSQVAVCSIAMPQFRPCLLNGCDKPFSPVGRRRRRVALKPAKHSYNFRGAVRGDPRGRGCIALLGAAVFAARNLSDSPDGIVEGFDQQPIASRSPFVAAR